MKPDNSFDSIIIGGGIIGSSTALNLSLRGRRVLVLEKSRAGTEASGVNAGGVRRMYRDVAEIPLSVEAMELWYGLNSMTGSDCGFKQSGIVRIAPNHKEMAKLEKRAALTRSLGWEHEELIDKDELKKIVPLASPHCKGAMISRGDGFADPYRSTRAIFQTAQKKGAHFLEQTMVTAIESGPGELWRVHCGGKSFEAPSIINCAGAWGARIAAMVGDDLPVHAEAPTMMVTAKMAPFLTPVVTYSGHRLSFKQMENGTVVIGGGYRSPLNMKTEQAELSFAELKISARTVAEIFPHMKTVPIIRSWNGIEGVTPDKLPIICASEKASGIFHATGFSAHGFQLGPIVGKIMADLVVEGETRLPIEPFHMNRFNNEVQSVH